MADADKTMEKKEVEAVENGYPSDVSDSHVGLDDSNLPDYHNKETDKILHKVDFRLIPLLTFLYVLSFLDRSNIANANVAGMSDTLGMSDQQYRIANTVFFFPYALLEVPSNIILKTMRPSTWITCMMLSWGVVMTLQGIVSGYYGLIATRVMLGVCEAGFFPAATYVVSTWYCRFEVQRRLAVFYSAAALAGAFSGLLAYGIINMDGVGGLEGWRWIFILEGIITVVVGATLHWTLPDSPETATFLTPHERAWLIRRLQQDAGTASGQVETADTYKLSSILSALKDWRLWTAIICWMGNSIPIYGFTYTLPAIIEDLGYTAANAQLMTIPLYTTGVISVLGFSWWADKRQTRWKFVVGPYCICTLGYVALLAIPHPRFPGLTYFFLFLIPIGIYPALISLCSWIANNIAPSWKRAVGMALVISGGNLGGTVGSNIFLASQAPSYPLGYGLSMAMNIAAICAALLMRWSWGKENKQRDQMNAQEIREKYTEQELVGLGDKSPLYRYVL